MSMSHKAYLFAWRTFASELSDILYAALSTGSVERLAQFIDEHARECKDLAFGEPLTAEWREQVDSSYDQLQQIADLALTKYYEPNDDLGLAESWMDVQEKLSPTQRAALLGEPFGPEERLFDPGYQGSYFQDPDTVHRSLAALADEPEVSSEFLKLLETAAAKNEGVYVTF